MTTSIVGAYPAAEQKVVHPSGSGTPDNVSAVRATVRSDRKLLRSEIEFERMAERTTRDDVMSRAELAAYFAALAEEFDGDEEEVDIALGNKTVSLSPPAEVNVSTDIIERSSRLRGSRETVKIEMSWKPESTS
jgi:amphi-Trp domain-containing protein